MKKGSCIFKPRSHDFAEWERLLWLVVVRVVRFSLTRILLSAHFECTPSGTSKRALEKCWFGQSQPSTDGEAEFNIKKS